MGRCVFHDLDEFADSIGGVTGRFVPTARGSSDWWIETARINSAAVQQIQMGGAATFAGDSQGDSLMLGVPMTDPLTVRIDGQTLDERSLVVVRPGRPFTLTGLGVTRWAGVTLPMDHAAMPMEMREALRSCARRGAGIRFRSDPPGIRKLRALVLHVCSADAAPWRMEGAACAAAEREVIDVAARSLARSLCVEAPHVGRPQFSRRRVIARALALIEASEGQPLVVQDLCKAAQVSERTLRNVFREYFGVGPMRLVRVRQLHEIRCALANADAICNTVTRVASQFGVWDFSLFARNYKALYGESPSDTLHRPPRRRDAFAQRSWIRYALRTCVDEAPGVAQRDDDALRPVERLAERVGCNV